MRRSDLVNCLVATHSDAAGIGVLDDGHGGIDEVERSPDGGIGIYVVVV